MRTTTAWRSAAVVLIALTFVVSGCGRQEVTPAASVTAVVVDGGDRALVVGESTTLSATVSVTGDADTTVAWTSSDTSVVTIDDTGLATATAIGTATITATSTYDAQTNDSISLTVTGGPEVLSVVIDGGDRSLSLGQSVTLSATVTVTGDAATTVAWTSSDTSVVSIDDTGLATAVAAGAAIITATSSHDPRTSDSITLTVQDALPASDVRALLVQPASVLLTGAGEQATVRVVAVASDGSTGAAHDLGIEWRSSDPGAVSVEPDPNDPTILVVTAQTDVGSSVIAAAATDGSGLLSNPAGVSIAALQPGVTLLPDDSVVFPEPGASSDPGLPPPHYEMIGGTPTIAGFSEQEIADLLEVDGLTLLYPVILGGAAPNVGDLLLSDGEGGVMGHVTRVVSRNGLHLVQVRQADLGDVFEQFVFSFDSQALEAQGVVSSAALFGVARSEIMTAATDASRCKLSGGFTLADLTLGALTINVTPHAVWDVDLGAGIFMFVFKYPVSLRYGFGLDLQAGVTGSVECPLAAREQFTTPIPAGPLAAILSAGFGLQPVLEVSASVAGLPRLSASAEVGADIALDIGVDVRPSGGSNPNRLDVEPIATFDLVTTGALTDATFSLTPGVYVKGDAGIQLGGVVLERTCTAVRWIPLIGNVCDDVAAALFLDVLNAKLGAEVQGVFDSPARVASNRDSDSRLVGASVATATLESKSLNEILKRFKLAPLSLPLVTVQRDGPTFYRVFRPNTIHLDSPAYQGPVSSRYQMGRLQQVEAEIGDILEFTINATYAPSLLPLGDTPLHSGEVWTARPSVSVWFSQPTHWPDVPVTIIDADTMRASVEVTESLCERGEDGSLALHFLGYNRMAGVLPTAGYVGGVELVCIGEVSLDIAPGELSDALPNTLYPFELIAEGIPASVDTVRFEWAPGLGPGGSATVAVVGGEARTTIDLSYAAPGTYTLQASVYDGATQLAVASAPIEIVGTTLAISPPGLADAEANVAYTFDFEADDIAAGVSEVTFAWTFGVGAAGTGSSTAPVVAGRASASATHTYGANGAYGLVVDLRDAGTNALLAQRSVTVTVGPAIEREYDLDICDTWRAAGSGGQGVTTDTWDISMIAPGAIFDMQYNAFGIPDKYLVEYPEGNLVLDTGWRGNSSYEGNPLYPGGIAGPGSGTALDMFTRLSAESFRVTVIGPQSGTAWNYSIRCRIPN